MATSYPGGTDDFPVIPTDAEMSGTVGGRTHRAMHNDLGDAIEAVQGELGTDPSGASATVKARFEVIEANDWVTSARIADGTIAATDVAAGTFAAFGTVGNLLTANQASIETDTTGWSASLNCTISRNAGTYLHGTTALAMVSAGAGDTLAQTTVAQVPVTPGGTYTAVASFISGAVSRTAKVGIQWFDGGGAWIAAPAGSAVSTTVGGAWQQSVVTAVAPANAATANVYLTVIGCTAASEYHFADCIGLWRGASGQWAMPGQPIIHTGIRPNPSNTAEVQIWNDATATWITV